MSVARISGTEGYAEDAERFATVVDDIRFADVHSKVLQFIPNTPCRVLDIGSGSGRDAAAFAAMGHDVVAVEPVAELRERAACWHISPRIKWIDDCLPQLACLGNH